jgi:subtilase family serine protease
VAIVDAYDDPNAESDLATYRAQYGLPACTTASGCFQKVAQDGSTNYPPPPPSGDDWVSEITLDLDAVSAACPACRILLVEADSDLTASDDLPTAVETARTMGAEIISMSWGGRRTAWRTPGTHSTSTTRAPSSPLQAETTATAPARLPVHVQVRAMPASVDSLMVMRYH